MQMPPVTMVADTKVAHIGLVVGRLLHRYGKCLRAIGTSYDATVAEGLLYVMVVLLNLCPTIAPHGFIERDRTQVCGRKNEVFQLAIKN